MLGEYEMSKTTGGWVYLDSNLPIVQNHGKMHICCRGEIFVLEISVSVGQLVVQPTS